MKRQGDMYSWVTHTWTPIGGKCPNRCHYCYVNDLKKRFPAVAKKYSGKPRLVGPWPKFKAGDTVFVCHMTDIGALPWDLTQEVLHYCLKYQGATYVFQSRSPERFLKWSVLPDRVILGTTMLFCSYWVEDDMRELRSRGYTTFITVEPIHKFHSEKFIRSLIEANPCWVNIGADSKNHGIEEPTKDETLELIQRLRYAGIDVRLKKNLARIIGEENMPCRKQ